MGNSCSQTSSEHALRMKGRKYNWRPSPPDPRDHRLVLTPRHKALLPPKVDLRPKEHLPIYDQGLIGSCTANAVGAAFRFELERQGLRPLMPSRLFIYYNARVLEGTEGSDSGATLRDGIRAVATYGVCDEELWPYHFWRFAERPSEECYREAHMHRCLQYARLDHTIEDFKACLAMGFPFVFGFTVFASFECGASFITGRMSMPWSCDYVFGAHAVMACGYDDEEQVFIIRNSWSSWWGDGGYFYMPYDFIKNPEYCDDFWAIRWCEDTEFPTDKPPAPRKNSSKNCLMGLC